MRCQAPHLANEEALRVRRQVFWDTVAQQSQDWWHETRGAVPVSIMWTAALARSRCCVDRAHRSSSKSAPRLQCLVVDDPHAKPIAQERQQVAAPAEARPSDSPRKPWGERSWHRPRLAAAVNLQAPPSVTSLVTSVNSPGMLGPHVERLRCCWDQACMCRPRPPLKHACVDLQASSEGHYTRCMHGRH